MGLKIAVAAALATAALAASAQAGTTTINTLPVWDGSTFVGPYGGSGSFGTGVYGETFVAPASTLNSFTFEVDDGGTALNGVFAQVYAWSGPLVGGNAPQGATGPALFSSGPFTISASSGFQAVTVNTGFTALTPGDNYVILLADTSGDSGGAGFGLILSGSGVAGDGGFNYYNNDHTLASISAGPWDDTFNNGSLAFSATFGATPEPATWAFMMLGVGGVGLTLRRRRDLATIAG